MKEHLFNFHDVFLLISTAICLLLFLFQWVFLEKRPGRGVLAFFLLSLALTNITILFMWSDKIALPEFASHWILPFTLMFSLMIHGPLLFLYVRMLTAHSPQLILTDIWHCVPVTILILVLLVFDVSSIDLLLRLEYNPPVNAVVVIWTIAKIQPVIYCMACVIMVMQYIKRLQHQYASFSLFEPIWLMLLSGGFFLCWGWSLMVYILAKFVSPALADSLGIIDNYATLALIISLFIYGVSHAKNLLHTKPRDTLSTQETVYQKQDITRLEKSMEEDKLYLEHNINIERMADRIKLNSRTVSQIINNHFKTNFYEYINSYRIAEAKRLLADDTLTDQTIRDVLLKSGFNSKSAFHRFFNRLVGMSPTAYRQKMTTSHDR